MNLGELKTYLAESILQRPELVTDSSPMLLAAIQMGHKQVQLDADFRCMEDHVDISYPANTTDGVEIPDENYKKPRNVFVVSSTVRTPILPTTEDEVNMMLRDNYQNTRVASLNSDDFHQRWYEKEMRICLLFPPSDSAVKIRLEYYKFLPTLTEDTDEDYFTKHLWLMLLNAAAWQGSISLWEEERSEMFLNTYTALRNQAVQQDKIAKQGGAYRVYRPPLAVSRRR